MMDVATDFAREPSYGVVADTSSAPVMVYTYPQAVTPDNIRQLFALYRAAATEHERVAWVIDLSGFNPLTASAELRLAFTREYEKSRAIIAPATIGEARVTSSMFVRSMLAAVDLVLRHPHKTKNFATVAEAKVWAEKKVRESRS